MTIQEFFDKWNGQGCDYDGYYGDQCMDLANQYNQDVVGAPRLTGNAVDVWTTYPQQAYGRINNTPDGVPQEGDIIIWGTSIGQYGHIAVFKSGDSNSFTSFDQNWPLNSVCHFQPHNYSGVLGWLRPKQASASPEIVPITPASTDDTRIHIGVNPATSHDYGDPHLSEVRNIIFDYEKQRDSLASQATLLQDQVSKLTITVNDLSTKNIELAKENQQLKDADPQIVLTPAKLDFKNPIASFLYQLAVAIG